MGRGRLDDLAGITVEVSWFGAYLTASEDPEPHSARWLSVLRLRSTDSGDASLLILP